MSARKVETVIAVAGNCYGVGPSIETARRNLRRELGGAALPKDVSLLLLSAKREQVEIFCDVTLHIRWPATEWALRIN